MGIFLELYRHNRLSNKRSPLHELNQYIQFVIYLSGAFWVCYLMFFAIILAFGLEGGAVEPYHLLNKSLPLILAADFVVRAIFQKMPTQEMKPYLLLPVRRGKLVDFMLLRSATSWMNTLLLFLFVPFAILTVARFYGMAGVVEYCFGIWLLTIANNYWFILCRLLIGESFWWVMLPLGVGGALTALNFCIDGYPVANAFMNIGEAYITGDITCFLLTVLAIAALFMMCKKVTEKVVYSEMNKATDSKQRHITNFTFLDRYGEIGEYVRLELKLLTRNKVNRQQMTIISITVIVMSSLIAFTDTYHGGMKDFLIIYNYVIFGVMFLGSLMSFEGNYIDGLMSRKESIYSLLCAKYILYVVAMFIPSIFMLPGMVNGSVSTLNCIAWQVFTSGCIFFFLFQLSVYNNRTVPMNEKVTNRNYTGGGKQNVISLLAMGLPITIGLCLKPAIGENILNILLTAIGLAFIFTYRKWMRNIYRRFMRRRYVNLDGFRNSRQK